ncbi:uncharacterized protein LOC124645228 [Helicoverpa zea]|uniref:uncharacterized protein LOC124645228 n=1 Tax=Helicoverpa zea TaxID=7113 RepID=UPI001F581E22|nr:uncharacterized protein LOC124645228 [Helicoverpa zea]
MVQVMCITEHWHRNSEIIFLNNSNYTVQSSFVRKETIHGGSLIIVTNNLKCKERSDIVKLSVERNVELSCVELEQFVIICVYRPPSGDFNTFESVMENSLSKLNSTSKSLLVCGDFNVNILESSSLTTRLLNLFKSFNLVNLFLEPTRITATSSTCLDNIFTNCSATETLITNGLTSDHCGQLARFPDKKNKIKREITCRPLTTSRFNRFKNNINAKLDSEILNKNNPHLMYGALFDIIKYEFNSSFKTKTLVLKETANFNEWATPGIYKSRAKLYELYEMKNYNFDENFIRFVRNYSKLFKKVCHAAKSMYFSNKIKNSKSIIKATWNIINSETGKIKQRDNQYKIINENQVYEKDSDVAREFNIRKAKPRFI